MTEAELTLENNIALRLHEFGSDFPRCITAGRRRVTLSFNIFESVDAQTAGLYQAAVQRSPISGPPALRFQPDPLKSVSS